MKRQSSILLFCGLLVISFFAFSFAQENTTAAPAAEQSVKPVSTEWLYGEVNSVDIAAKSVTLTYLDYDTDIEKQATVYVDAKTVFENVKSLEEIKSQDVVSIDYVSGPNSKNLAISLSVEKPENAEDMEMGNNVPVEPKQEMKPAQEASSPEAAVEQPKQDAESPDDQAGEPVKAQ
jgi:hypothetical protein